jgi:sialate O-acetylesterase
MDRESLASFKDIKAPADNDTAKADRLRPTCLFNGMVAPIVGFGIRGFLWYQGETNVPHPSGYDKLMKSMVDEWRTLWKRDTLPFYYVQIAPWIYRANRDSVAILRERQQMAQQEIPNSGMVVSIDKGNEFTIHPPDKTAIARRLLYWALGQTYQMKGIAYQSPLYKSMQKKGDTITIKFTATPFGFTSYDREINAFEIAGRDHVFYPAKARIYKNSIQVSSGEVSDPVAVRYAFKDWVIGNLYNTGGLPVAPFRTDDW